MNDLLCTGWCFHSRALAPQTTWTSRTSSDASVVRRTIEAEAIPPGVSRSLFRVKLPVVRNQLGCAPAAHLTAGGLQEGQQLAMPAWVTSHVSYRGVRGEVAQCGGPGRTDHSSPKEIAARVMGPCLAHRVVDAAASEQDDVASVESCSSRLLAPSVLPETRS